MAIDIVQLFNKKKKMLISPPYKSQAQTHLLLICWPKAMGVISNRDREIDAWFKRKTIIITGLFEDRQVVAEGSDHSQMLMVSLTEADVSNAWKAKSVLQSFTFTCYLSLVVSSFAYKI